MYVCNTIHHITTNDFWLLFGEQCLIMKHLLAHLVNLTTIRPTQISKAAWNMMNLRKYKHNQKFIKTAVLTHNFHSHKHVGLLLPSQRATTWPRALTIKQVPEHMLFTQTTPSTSLHTNVTNDRQHRLHPCTWTNDRQRHLHPCTWTNDRQRRLTLAHEQTTDNAIYTLACQCYKRQTPSTPLHIVQELCESRWPF